MSKSRIASVCGPISMRGSMMLSVAPKKEILPFFGLQDQRPREFLRGFKCFSALGIAPPPAR